MKLCFKILLLFVCLEFVDASKDSLILDGNVRDEDNGLLSDGSVTATQENNNVRLVGYGRINLTLDYGVLEFEVCKGCMGKSAVCYESEIGFSHRKAAGTCFESSCKVEIEGKTDEITFGGIPCYKKLLTGCITSRMNYEFADVVSSQGSLSIYSCNPKKDEKNMVKLRLSVNEKCPIRVKNAKIYAPEIQPTTPLPLTEPIKNKPANSQKDSLEASSFPIWGYIIIIVGIVVLIVILIIGFIIFYLYRKRQTSKRFAPNVDETKPKSTVSKAKDAKIETPSKQDVEAAKVEPKKKKTKPIEPTTTEDISTPTVKQQKPPTRTKQQLPPPNPAACYPVGKRIIPRSMKSAKTDSLDETLKKGKSVMMESESVIF
uniref:Uncharacterized protein n=1 Tax=Panagrolaimus davidi TaxID=227884 RepID=A0A914R9Y7_9BILA